MKKTETLKIEGMSCNHCVKSVQSALSAIDNVDVDAVEIGTATVQIEGDSVNRATLVEAIEEIGFEVVES